MRARSPEAPHEPHASEDVAGMRRVWRIVRRGASIEACDTDSAVMEGETRWSHPGIRAGVWFALLGLFFLVYPYFVYTVSPRDGRFFVSSMIATLVLATAALGLNVIAGYSGMLSLGHAFFMAVGAYAMVKLAGPVLPPWLALPAAVAVGALVGAFVALFCVHLKGLYLAVVTFLVVAAVRPLSDVFTSFFGGQPGARPVERLEGIYPAPGEADLAFAPSEAFQIRFYFVCAAVVMVVMYLVRNLTHSRWGRAWMAMRDSDLAARAAGVPVYRYRVIAFATSAALAALAGVLFSQNPSQAVLKEGNFTFLVSFQLVFVVVFGGLGTVSGPLLGALALGVVFPLVLKVTGLDGVPGIYGIIVGWILVITVIAMPDGIMGSLRSLWARVLYVWVRRGGARHVPKTPTTTESDRTPRPSRHHAVTDGPILELRGVSVVFGGLRAVDKVDIAVRPGAIHAVIGPNGSGKTTLVNATTGFYRPTEGRVWLEGADMTGRRPHELATLGIARTFQNLQIWRRMSVIENVMVGMHPRTRGRFLPSMFASWALGEESETRRRAYGLLEHVGLETRAWDSAGDLPFADQRLLEIARALAADPILLALDEPAAGMNPSESRDLMRLISDIRDKGITILLIEHHMEVVMELSDRITVLDYGAKIAEGTPEEIRADTDVVAAYLGAQ